MLPLSLLLPQYLKETGNHQAFEINLDHAIQALLSAIADPKSLVLVAVRGRSIVGFLYATVATFFWSDTPVAVDQLLYVAPEHRGRVYGVHLIREYEKWASTQGVTEVRMSIASGITEDRTRTLYQRLGYQPLGYVYRKELQSGKRTKATSTTYPSQAP
jgi:GNAT superfamily N-acetyltransferase